MDLYQLLRQDHLKAKRLFERLGEAGQATNARTQLFAELKHELELHTEVEERHFYPALEGYDEAHDLVDEALEEHDEVRRLLEELDQAEQDSDDWGAQLAELQEEVEFHVEEEETELFPLAQQLLDKAKVEEIARAIEQDKAKAK